MCGPVSRRASLLRLPTCRLWRRAGSACRQRQPQPAERELRCSRCEARASVSAGHARLGARLGGLATLALAPVELVHDRHTPHTSTSDEHSRGDCTSVVLLRPSCQIVWPVPRAAHIIGHIDPISSAAAARPRRRSAAMAAAARGGLPLVEHVGLVGSADRQRRRQLKSGRR